MYFRRLALSSEFSTGKSESRIYRKWVSQPHTSVSSWRRPRCFATTSHKPLIRPETRVSQCRYRLWRQVFAKKGSFLRGLTAVGLESLGLKRFHVGREAQLPRPQLNTPHGLAFLKKLVFLSSSSLPAILLEAILPRMISTWLTRHSWPSPGHSLVPALNWCSNQFVPNRPLPAGAHLPPGRTIRTCLILTGSRPLRTVMTEIRDGCLCLGISGHSLVLSKLLLKRRSRD